jgi:hydroxyethylthiazole kinase-like uncharacterized protein yjeF
MFNRRIRVLAPRAIDANKYTHGVVGVIAGSDEYPGAGLLCVGGARRGGAGFINYLVTDRSVADRVIASYPDVVLVNSVGDSRANAWVIGPGAPKVAKRFALPETKFLVLDAGFVNLAKKSKAEFTVITPHEGEFKAMGYEVELPGDRIPLALKAARELGVFVLLKGSNTVIATPGGLSLVESSGGSELATAGTGDILAGFIGSMLASWNPDNEGAVLEVLIKSARAHAFAGKRAYRANRSLVATDLLDALARVVL